MSSRRAHAIARTLPWLIFALTASAAAAGYVLLAANGAPDLLQQIVLGVVFIGYAMVGALIASRRPEHRIGWILLGIPSFTGLGFTTEQYAIYAAAQPEALPVAGVAAWLASWTWFPGLGLLGFGLLLFPTGRLPSGRWRPILWLLIASIPVNSALFALAPTAAAGDFGFENPLGILPASLVSALEAPAGLLMVAAIVFSAAAPIVRFRHARSVERDQLKWFLSAAGLLAIVLPLSLVAEEVAPDGLSALLFPAALAGLPVAIGVAILRHRLFDIDLLINRALVYGALTVVLGAVYVGAILLLQGLLNPITGGGTLAVAASTLAVAALFRPVRIRVQAAVDRRFYRSRYDAGRTVAAFSGQLRGDVDLDALTDRLADTAADTMRPASVSVWLKQTEQAR